MPRPSAWPRRQRRMAAAALVAALALVAAALATIPLPWHAAPAAPTAPGAQGAALRMDLPQYQAAIQAQPVAGIQDNLSGLTYNPHTQTLFAVINRPPAVAELSTDGQLLRLMPVDGADDPEGITHIDGHLFAIADERRNRIHWVEIGPEHQRVSLRDTQALWLGKPRIRNFALEGLGWDAQRGQLLAVTEKWPLQVLAMDAVPGQKKAALAEVAIQHWASAPASGVPTTDLASIDVDPRTGNLLLLGEESSVLYEYTRAGEPVGMLPLWAGMQGLEKTIPQPEGVAVDPAGRVFIVSEPNLFYRYEKRS